MAWNDLTRGQKRATKAVAGVFGLALIGGLTGGGDSGEEPAPPPVSTGVQPVEVPATTALASTTTTSALATQPEPPAAPPAAPTDQEIAGQWGLWMLEYQQLFLGLQSDAERGDTIGLLSGCLDGAALIERTPPNFADSALADSTWQFLDAQRQAFAACVDGDAENYVRHQHAALERMTDMNERLDALVN